MEETPKSAISKVGKSRKSTRGRKPGATKSGGRKKGTPNKNTALFYQVLENAGLDIGVEIKKALKTANIEQKIRIFEMVLKHFPKPSEMEFKVGFAGADTAAPAKTEKEKENKLASV